MFVCLEQAPAGFAAFERFQPWNYLVASAIQWITPSNISCKRIFALRVDR